MCCIPYLGYIVHISTKSMPIFVCGHVLVWVYMRLHARKQCKHSVKGVCLRFYHRQKPSKQIARRTCGHVHTGGHMLSAKHAACMTFTRFLRVYACYLCRPNMPVNSLFAPCNQKQDLARFKNWPRGAGRRKKTLIGRDGTLDSSGLLPRQRLTACTAPASHDSTHQLPIITSYFLWHNYLITTKKIIATTT